MRRRTRVKDFDRRLWQRFYAIAKRYWASEERLRASLMLGLLVLLLVGRTAFSVLFNRQTGEFTSALAAHDTSRFWYAMKWFGVTLAAGVPIYALYYFVRDRLGIDWRRWLTHHLLDKYFGNRAYYELVANEGIDNPDQRLTDDVSTFTRKSLKFLLEMVSAVLTLIAFGDVLWSISRLLVGILVLYALIGTVLTFAVFGRPLIGLNFQQLRREADFRFGLIRVRENAEAIAFYQGEEREAAHVKQRFASLFANYRKLLKSTLGLNLFQSLYTFVTYALPSAVIAPRILSGELEVGQAVQAGGAFAAMLGALTLFIDNFEELSTFAAGVDRLHAFAKAVDAPKPAQSADDGIELVDAEALSLEGVTLRTPGGERTLLDDVTFNVAAGGGLAIVGTSGSGKSSLLRAIAGLWRSGSGRIMRPNLDQMLFLPQRPYMIWGTLREQLLYPSSKAKIADDELQALLERVNLSTLIERCGGLDRVLDFTKVLSVGEQQRLAIARALLARPTIAVLDEATSALDAENESLMYAELARLNATLISVTHHPELIEQHSQMLEVTGDGSWRLVPTKRRTKRTATS